MKPCDRSVSLIMPQTQPAATRQSTNQAYSPDHYILSAWKTRGNLFYFSLLQDRVLSIQS